MVLNSYFSDVSGGIVHVCERDFSFFFILLVWSYSFLVFFSYFPYFPSYMVDFIMDYLFASVMIVHCFNGYCFWPDISVSFGVQDIFPDSTGFPILCWEFRWNSNTCFFIYLLTFITWKFNILFLVHLMLWILFRRKGFLLQFYWVLCKLIVCLNHIFWRLGIFLCDLVKDTYWYFELGIFSFPIFLAFVF